MEFSKLCVLWLFACVCLSTVHIGYCQNNEGDTERDREPIEEGMDPLYKMTITFLDVIQPESKGNLVELILGKYSIEQVGRANLRF